MMKQLSKVVVYSLALMVASSAFATSFIVPDDEELVQKSAAIVTGVVVSAHGVERERGYVETLYEVALDRVLKGPFRSRSVITINSPGGATEKRYTTVQSAAHFAIGDQVLLFLTPHRGGWTPTDLTLGKFRFAVTSGGYGVLVRDADDIVGWDRDGNVHREKIRLEPEFLHFIGEAVAGRKAMQTYEVPAGEVLAPAAPQEKLRQTTDLFPAPATTYTVSFYTCALDRYPGRWETATMDAGVNFHKNSAQNASGLGDGGVSIIQNALAAWTNDCESRVNIQYGGTSANLKDMDDPFNMIIFNDPGDLWVPGTWQGSGTIAICFSGGGFTHTFDGTDFVSMADSDIVFQDGYAGTESSIQEAMTHEIGHGIGLRHSDGHYLQNCTAPGCVITCTQTACDSNVEECSSSAIMTTSVTHGIDFTLQTWDQHGADRLYPGDCVVVSPPANVIATATSTSVVNVSWSASVGATSYNVYRSTDGTNYALAGSTTSPTVTFNDTGRTANTAYLYKVRAVNGGESADSSRDLATTVIFTDDPLSVGTTTAKAVHITELRTAVNAVRAMTILGAGSYTDPTITAGVTTIKGVHITDLRSAIDAARTILTLTPNSYAEGITAMVTPIRVAHINELRNGVK